MRAIRQGGAGQLDHALIPFGMRALIDGEGKIPRTQQPGHRAVDAGTGLGARRRRRGEALGVELGIAAQVPVRGDVGNQQADRPVALNLQREDPVIFQCAGQQCGQRQRLAQHAGDRFGVIMAGQDGIDFRAKPHHAPAQAQRFDLEGQQHVFGDAMRAGTGGCHHVRHQRRMPFWPCSRFSASSQTTDCGPSMTSAETSSPRWAGRQCMKIASGLAWRINSAFT